MRAARGQLEGQRLAHDAARLVRAGVTSVHEAMRVAAQDVEDA